MSGQKGCQSELWALNQSNQDFYLKSQKQMTFSVRCFRGFMRQSNKNPSILQIAEHVIHGFANSCQKNLT